MVRLQEGSGSEAGTEDRNELNTGEVRMQHASTQMYSIDDAQTWEG